MAPAPDGAAVGLAALPAPARCACCGGAGHVERYGECPLCEGLTSWPSDDASDDAGAVQPLATHILALLQRYEPVTVPGMDPALHYLPPHVAKATWTQLGDAVAARERSSAGSVEGHRWISLRLDGSGFSKAVRSMRRSGVLEEEGFSETFAVCMQSTLHALMEHFTARLGYTQSDEMIVFIAPASVVRGEQQVHLRGGRVTKLTTLAAGFATANFLLELARRCVERGVSLDGLAAIQPHFDCRLGHYSSWEEAQGLLLWRAYDCSVNGVSDAVYQCKGSGKQIQEKGKVEKVDWLWKAGKLPLPPHQAYGTVLVKVRRKIAGQNPKLGTTVMTLRGVLERLDGPVLELARQGRLFPEDDTVEH